MTDELLDVAVFNELKETVGAEFVVELVDTFLEEAPPMLVELRNAMRAADADAFRRTAHSIKTNANTFGAKALGLQALALEQGGLPDDDTVLDAFEAVYAESASALKSLCNG